MILKLELELQYSLDLTDSQRQLVLDSLVELLGDNPVELAINDGKVVKRIKASTPEYSYTKYL